jgi:hypothetical protein
LADAPVSGSLNLFQLGARGVNVVTALTHLLDSELTRAQNAEMVSVGGESAIDQRPGMTKINAVSLGASVVMLHDLQTPLLANYTAWLYAGLNAAATHKWRRSRDGINWIDDDTPTKPFAANGNINGFFKNFPKAVTIDRLMYYVDGVNPIQLHSWDGATDTPLSTIPPAVTGSVMTAPTLFGVQAETETPITNATNYQYKFVAKQGANYSAASTVLAPFTSIIGPATLNATNYNAVMDSNFAGASYASIVSGTPGVTSFDVYRTVGGATQGKIGSIPVTGGTLSRGNGSALTGTTFPTSPPVLFASAGGTTFTYKFVAKDNLGNYGQPVSASINGDNSGGGGGYINISAYDLVSPVLLGGIDTVPAFTGSIDVYRTAGGATQGKIGTLSYTDGSFASVLLHDAGLVGDGSTPAAVGSGLNSLPSRNGFPDFNSLALSPGGVPVFSDAGLVADGSTAPTTASGGTAGSVLGVIDMITDGNGLFLAAIDANTTDPTVAGRILQYFPTTGNWLQLGASFPTAAGNGAAGTLAFFDGALSYGTYIGVASGNTSYLTSTGNPLPAGGIAEVHTTAASQSTCSMAVFNGELYVGYVSLVNATAAIIAKRAALATWTTVRTGPATTRWNAYTSLIVFGGTLFAGWTSGNGSAPAVIESSGDGTTWVTEYTLDAAEVVGQMLVFNNALYAVLARTGVAYNTKSRIIQRTASGVWSTVDDPTDDFAGCIGLVYA